MACAMCVSKVLRQGAEATCKQQKLFSRCQRNGQQDLLHKAFNICLVAVKKLGVTRQ